jgi:hypothetical protein
MRPDDLNELAIILAACDRITSYIHAEQLAFSRAYHNREEA